jgi:hypothetical protein
MHEAKCDCRCRLSVKQSDNLPNRLEKQVTTNCKFLLLSLVCKLPYTRRSRSWRWPGGRGGGVGADNQAKQEVLIERRNLPLVAVYRNLW